LPRLLSACGRMRRADGADRMAVVSAHSDRWKPGTALECTFGSAQPLPPVTTSPVGRLHQRRPAEKDRALITHDNAFHPTSPGHIGAAGRCRKAPSRSRYLRESLGADICALIVEDCGPKMARSSGENLVPAAARKRTRLNRTMVDPQGRWLSPAAMSLRRED